jgi:hypothetical protein
MGRRRLLTRMLRRTASTLELEADTATQCARADTTHDVRKAAAESAAADTISPDCDNDTLPPDSALPAHARSSSSGTTASRRRQVAFSHVEVRQYEQVVGDHPCCRTGCPLTLGWHYRVDARGEGVRERHFPALRLSDEARHDRLLAHGVPEGEMRSSLRRLHRVRTRQDLCHGPAKAQFFAAATPVPPQHC